MTTVTILPPARTVFLDANSNPLSGGYVYTYVPPNTSTLKTTWQDANQVTANPNPIVLDSQGSCLMYGSGQYLMELFDSNGNLIWSGLTQDVYGLITTGNNTFSGTNGFTSAVTFTSTVSLGSQATATTQSPGDNSTKVATDAFVTAAIAGAQVPAYAAINGCLITSLTGTNTTASATITSGQATNSANTAYITSAGYSWAASNGNAVNGTDASSSTLADSTTYHMFLISGSSGTGTFCSASLTPTFPTGYTTSHRRIGSFNTNSSGAPLSYTSIEASGGGTINWLTTQTPDIAVTNMTTSSRSLYTLNVPTGIKIEPLYRSNAITALQGIILTSGDETDVLPTVGSQAGQWITTPGQDLIGITASGYNGGGPGFARDGILTTNTSGQIGARSSSSTTATLYWVTRGWIDWRRV